ncbi:MAG: class I SAM-dependent methyltransferase [Nitrospirota bacterium]
MTDSLDVGRELGLRSQDGEVAWSVLYRHRVEARGRLGDIWDLPIVKRYFDRITANLATHSRVLEVGAGSRGLAARLSGPFPQVVYRSMDIDRTHDHDYYDLAAITERFDAIVLVEVIEHLALSDGIDLLDRLKGLLTPGGTIILTTPNVLHPTRYWGDCTHKTFYRYDEIAGILEGLGYRDVRVSRVYNAPFLQRWLRLHVGVYLHRYLDIDFAPTIVAEGRV